MAGSGANPGSDPGVGLTLMEALGIRRGDVVSLVGGGGKTSLALRLVAEASALGWRAAFTVTTRIFPPPLPLLLGPTLPDSLPDTPCCVAAGLTPEGKLAGLPPEQVGDLARLVHLTVVEADGSRGLPLKFPLEHEPVIPAATTLVLPVAGASVAGQPLMPDYVHRADAAAAFLSVDLGTSVTPAMAATLLWHPDAAARGRPANARVVPVLNQADTPERLAFARETAGFLAGLGAPLVLITSAAQPDPVVAIVRTT